MPRSRLITGLLLILAACALGAMLPGCESKPSAPEFDNPFDRTGPDGGDPLQLTASVAGNSILLLWNQPQGLGIKTYDVSHSLTASGGYEYVATVDATTAPTNQYTYTDPAPTAVHYFKVQAFTESGDFSLVAEATPAVTLTGPTVAVDGDPARTRIPSRFLTLTVTVTSEDSILIATAGDFSDAVSYPVITPGEGQDIPWTLPQAAQGDTLTIYARSYTGAIPSATTERNLIVDFAPEFNIPGKPATVATRAVDLQIDISGVQQMRFALSEDGLADAAWLPADTLLTGFMLDDAAVPQTIHGEFQGDFGFNATATWDVAPDLLQDASFSLDLPDGDVAAGETVTGLCSALATLMRFSTRPDFQDAVWQTYVDTAVIALDPAEGLQTVYAQFRNDWTDSDILTDTVVHVTQPVSVGFLAPREGQVVLGGTSLQMQGFSTTAAKTAADSIAVDLADGLGFRPVTADDPWTITWDVPRFEADTELNLRARAWAAGDSATAAITVTVSQLTLAILEPAEGDTLAADADVSVSGTAGGILGGAPLDQITVQVDGQILVAEGTDIWTVTWHTPVVTEPAGYTILVTVSAGADSYSREVGVVVAP